MFENNCDHDHQFIRHVSPGSPIKMYRCSKCNHTKCDDHVLSFDFKIMNVEYYSCKTCKAVLKR